MPQLVVVPASKFFDAVDLPADLSRKWDPTAITPLVAAYKYQFVAKNGGA